MLGCIISVESFVCSVIGAIITALFAIWKYYKERKYAVKMQAYIEYATAFQELVAHMPDDASRPYYQNAYFIALSKVYMCAPLSVLDHIREFHSNVSKKEKEKEDMYYYRHIISAMRSDLKMKKSSDFPFEVFAIYGNKERDAAKLEISLQTNCPFLTAYRSHQKCDRSQ